MLATLILILHLLGMLAAKQAAAYLLIIGAAYIGAEIIFTSFGLLGLNGALALYISYSLYYGVPLIMDVPMDWSFILGIGFVEAIGFIIALSVFMKARRLKTLTGREGLIGDTASVVTWHGQKGKVFVMGETWNAQSLENLDLDSGQPVIIKEIHNLTLTISKGD